MKQQYNYDPMGQAMQMLQVLGQRKAQQQGNDMDQRRLELEAQKMAQQGSQFDQNLGMNREEMSQRGSQFDRGLALNQQEYEQRGSQFNRRQGFDEGVQTYNEGRNAQMDPMAQAYQQAQTDALKLNIQQAPEELMLKRLNAAVAAGQLSAEQARQVFLEKHYNQQDQLEKSKFLADYAQGMLPVMGPDRKTPMPNPIQQQIMQAIMQWHLQGLPQAGPPPVQFNASNKQ
jgi:hypothetical protein